MCDLFMSDLYGRHCHSVAPRGPKLSSRLARYFLMPLRKPACYCAKSDGHPFATLTFKAAGKKRVREHSGRLAQGSSTARSGRQDSKRLPPLYRPDSMLNPPAKNSQPPLNGGWGIFDRRFGEFSTGVDISTTDGGGTSAQGQCRGRGLAGRPAFCVRTVGRQCAARARDRSSWLTRWGCLHATVSRYRCPPAANEFRSLLDLLGVETRSHLLRAGSPIGRAGRGGAVSFSGPLGLVVVGCQESADWWSGRWPRG